MFVVVFWLVGLFVCCYCSFCRGFLFFVLFCLFFVFVFVFVLFRLFFFLVFFGGGCYLVVDMVNNKVIKFTNRPTDSPE